MGPRSGLGSCLGFGGGETNQPRGCGGENVEIALYCDFHGKGKGGENLLSVFLAFHGPPFSRPIPLLESTRFLICVKA